MVLFHFSAHFCYSLKEIAVRINFFAKFLVKNFNNLDLKFILNEVPLYTFPNPLDRPGCLGMGSYYKIFFCPVLLREGHCHANYTSPKS